jgi:hypothetical protein
MVEGGERKEERGRRGGKGRGGRRKKGNGDEEGS